MRAFGAILYNILTDTLPFPRKSWDEVNEKTRSGEYPIPVYLSSEAQDLVKKLLTPNPEDKTLKGSCP